MAPKKTSKASSRAAKKRRRLSRRWKRFARVMYFVAAILLLAFAVLTLREMEEVKKRNDVRDLYPGTAYTPARFAWLTGSVALADELPPQEMQEDFTALYQLNADIAGWLNAGEKISGQVLFRDNEYYMDHNIYGEASMLGELFVDEACPNWDSDPFVIIYGHNKRNGTMFGSLSDFRDPAHLSVQPVIEWRTIYDEVPEEYVPFAVFDASMSSGNSNYFHLRRFELFEEQDVAGIENFLWEIKARSLYEIPVDVTSEDRVLALVTCSYSDDNGRLMVFCRALREGETRESVAALFAEPTPSP